MCTSWNRKFKIVWRRRWRQGSRSRILLSDWFLSALKVSSIFIDFTLLYWKYSLIGHSDHFIALRTFFIRDETLKGWSNSIWWPASWT